MKKFLFMISIAALLFAGCSSDQFAQFQQNQPDPFFNIFHLFDNYPSLKAAWDSVDGGEGNARMARFMSEDKDSASKFLDMVGYIMTRADNPGLNILPDLKGLLALLLDNSERFYRNANIGSFYSTDPASTYLTDFFAVLDNLTTDAGGTTPKMSQSVLGMNSKMLSYVLTKTDAEIETTMNDLVTSLTEDADPADGTPDIKATLLDLADLAAKATVLADYPMWILPGANPGLDTLETNYGLMPSRTNSDLGNSAQGIQQLMSGMIALANGETVDRANMYSMIGKLQSALSDPEIIKRLIWNMSNYFTVNGNQYGTLNTTNTNVTTNIYNTDNNGVLYSNSELSETLRQTLTGSGALFLRDDRRGSMVWRNGVTSTEYPLARLLQNVKKCYANWDTAQIKESIYDMIRYDIYGRDRQTDINAYSVSFLEHLLYTSAISLNIGYQHRPNTNELNNPSGDNYSAEQVGRKNGHGNQTGYVTLNDSLFALMTSRDAIADAIGAEVGMYELGFDGSGNNKGQDRVFRRYHSFTNAVRDSYKFKFSWNFPVLQFMQGAGVGDAGYSYDGTLNGGNENGNAGFDQYIPYSRNGTYMKDLATWTFSWVIRACWEGEGPYYSKQGATNAGNLYTYYRPDGSIYCQVNKTDPNNWTYSYPVSATYDKTDPDNSSQRHNRYKASWNTDYMMIRTEASLEQGFTEKNWGIKDSNGDTVPDQVTDPQYRTYNEIYPEPSTSIIGANRECSTYEEAIYRNFQWVANEKKYTIIIPLWLRTSVLGLAIEAALFQILEGNGFVGLSCARSFRGNGVWAKQNNGNTGDSSPISNIPGDYRIIILSKPVQIAFGAGNVTAAKALSMMNAGSAVPGPIAHNIMSISRLAFPRSAKITSGTDYEHKILGSQKTANSDNTDVGFLTTDSVWKKRNAILPLFIALLAPMRENSWYDPTRTPVQKNSLAIMLEGLSALVKPMIFFNYDSQGDGVSRNAWLARMKQGAATNYNKNHSMQLSPDCAITGFSTAGTTGWYGGDTANDFFTPKSVPSLLSVLTDSDTALARNTQSGGKYLRADGLLSKMVYYDVAAGRPTQDETPVTPTTPDMVSINKILFGLEQMTTAMKGAKAKGTLINENMSNGTLATIKDLDIPEWRFTKRPRVDNPAKYVDLDLDKILTDVIGIDGTHGLNKYHDTNATYSDGTPSWSSITNTNADGAVDNIQSLINNFLVQNAPYGISENLFDILDVMLQHNLTDAQIKGLLYTLGKNLAWYNGSTYYLQSENASFSALYNLLHNALPAVDTVINDWAAMNGMTKGAAYKAFLTAMRNTTKEGALVPFIVESVHISPYNSEVFVGDLYNWLNSPLISGANTPFYSTLGRMLDDMGNLVFTSLTPEQLQALYEYYGFQANERKPY